MNKYSLIDIIDNKLIAYNIINNQKETINVSTVINDILVNKYTNYDITDNTLIIKNYDVTFAINNYESVRGHDDFLLTDLYLKNQMKNIRLNKKREILKNRKKSVVKRIATYALAFSLSLPGLHHAVTDNLEIDNFTFDDVYDDGFFVDNTGSYIFQGITHADDYTFISAYDGNELKNSKVFVLNKNNEIINRVTLYNKAHVGGICYDPEHQMFWIADVKGTISGYRKGQFLYSKNQIVEPIYKQMPVGEDLINFKGNPAVSYITYDDNKIYVGNFTMFGGAFLKEYSLREDGSINLNNPKVSSFFNYVQGLSFYHKDGEKYMCVSSSFGAVTDSNLKIIKYDDKTDDHTNSRYINCKVPPMLEQISVDNDGKVVSIFEANAPKYKNFLNDVFDVVSFDVDEVITKSTARL